MALTKATYGMISADTSTIDLNIDANTLYVDSSANRVGIGTASPSSLLHLNSSSGHTITSTFTGQETYSFQHGTSGFYVKKDNVFLAGLNQNHDLVIFNTSGGEYARFDGSSGNVGIGTTAPGARLHVAGGNILLNNALEIRTKDTGGNIRTIVRANSSNELEYGWSANAPVKFMGGGSYTERMRIHTDGNIGIGETSPSAKLHVKKTAASTQHYDLYATAIIEDTEGRLQIVATDGGSNASALLLSNEEKHWGIVNHGPSQNNTFGIGYYATSSSGADIADALSNALTITTAGNVGIGTTSPARNLSIVHASAPHIQLALSSDQAASNGFEIAYDGSANYIAGRENVPTLFTTNNTTALTLDASQNAIFAGQIHLTGSSSSIRSNNRIAFNAISGAAQTGLFKSVAAQTSYANSASDGMFNALNGYAVGTGTGTTVIDASRNLTNIGTISSGSITSSGYGIFGVTTIDPDSHTSRAGGIGNIADGSGWGARGLFVHGGGTGDGAAIAHNGNNLYFGIQNGSAANSMATWMEVTPARVVSMSGAASVALPNTTAGTITITSATPYLLLTDSDTGNTGGVEQDGTHLTIGSSSSTGTLRIKNNFSNGGRPAANGVLYMELKQGVLRMNEQAAGTQYNHSLHAHTNNYQYLIGGTSGLILSDNTDQSNRIIIGNDNVLSIDIGGSGKHKFTASNLQFTGNLNFNNVTNSSYIGPSSTVNIEYGADGYHRFKTYNGSWGTVYEIADTGLYQSEGNYAYHSAVPYWSNPSSPGSYSTSTNTAYSESTLNTPDRGEKLVAQINARAFTKYLHIKTNVTANNIMHYFRIRGYFYGHGMEECVGGGYTYNNNSVLNKNFVRVYGDGHNIVDIYRSSSGNLVLKVDINQIGYTEGRMYVFFSAFSETVTRECQVIAVQQRDDNAAAF